MKIEIGGTYSNGKTKRLVLNIHEFERPDNWQLKPIPFKTSHKPSEPGVLYSSNNKTLRTYLTNFEKWAKVKL